MKTSQSLWKKSASSARWLTRQSNDPYVKARFSNPTGQSPAYRSRASFKLLSLNSKYPFLLSPNKEFETDKIVVDLGAAPGGWSQVAAHLLGGKGRVFGLDILDFPSLPGVHSLKGDFLDVDVQEELRKAVEEFRPPQFGLAGGYKDTEGEGSLEDERPGVGGIVEGERKRGNGGEEGIVDVVLSDMMAPMTGVRLANVQASLDLVEAATKFAFDNLISGEGEEPWLHHGKRRYPGGHFLVKFFQHPDLDGFKKEVLMPRFHKVTVEKPPESRKDLATLLDR